MSSSEQFIKQNYIQHVIGFLRGTQTTITDRMTFQKVVVHITEQCDANDLASTMYILYKKILADYFAEDVLPAL